MGKAPDIHVMPNDGKHAESPECFCAPRLDYTNPDTGVKVWVHKGPEELCQ